MMTLSTALKSRKYHTWISKEPSVSLPLLILKEVGFRVFLSYRKSAVTITKLQPGHPDLTLLTPEMQKKLLTGAVGQSCQGLTTK